jgi:HEAT repeat protein
MAAWALGQIEDSTAVRSLTPLLKDPDTDVRVVAAWALGQIESASALPALEAAAKAESSPSVRAAVRWAIRQIDDDRR